MKRIFYLWTMAVLLLTQYAMAQNTGPFSPDYSGFVPADNTKAVNLVSGDFFYTLPIITVPGPQGGFPLGLSYEAGITFDQEASWVGLGWSLTPGSINRAVNGFPDDWKGKEVHYVIPDGTKTITQDLSWPGYVSYGLQNKLGVNKLLHGFYTKTTHAGQINSKRAYGALYAKAGASAAVSSGEYTGYNVMDVYAVNDGSNENNNANANVDAIDESFTQFHNYDYYNLSVQGLVGSIQPRINDVGPLAFDPVFASLSADVSDTKSDYAWSTEDGYNTDKSVYFSFIHKHNSYFEANLGDFSVVNTSGSAENIFSTEYSSTNDDVSTLPTEIQDQYLQTSAFNGTDHRRIEANHIEYFTNGDIISNLSTCQGRGFIEAETLIDRTAFDADGIGAFVVTDKNGMSYHFALPVYQYEEIFSQQNSTGTRRERIIKADPYAYTWLLTAIVGPDYIDENSNQQIDESDLGYWVKFDYGLWSDGYQWRIPYSGDIYKAYERLNATGRKQIYYLDRITTPSHSAFFIKNIREDALSSNAGLSETLTDNYNSGKIYENDFTNYSGGDATHTRQKDISITPGGITKTLRLEKILIVPNQALSGISMSKTNASALATQITGSVEITEGATIGSTTYSRDIVSDTDYNSMMDDNVFDVNDNLTALENAAIQTVDLTYDYSLEVGTANATTNNGKLTLKSLNVEAYGNNSDLPPYEFSYYSSQSTPTVYTQLFYETNKPVDDWGLIDDHPEENALKEILYPEGKRLEVVYEPDMYYLINEDYEKEFTTTTLEYPYYPYISRKEVGYKTNFTDSIYGGYRVKELIVKNQNQNFVTKYNYAYDDKDHGGATVLYKPYVYNRSQYVQGYEHLPYVTPLYKRVEVIDYGIEDPEGHANYRTKNVTTFETCDKIFELFEYNKTSSGVPISDYSHIDYDGILKLEWKTTFLDQDGKKANAVERIVHDNSHKLGRINGTRVYNQFDELMGGQSYEFADDYALTAGINKEAAYNIAYTTEGDDHWNLSVYSIREYPQVSYQINSGQENSNSASTATKFDLITGIPVVLESGYNASEITPAYRIAAYDAMGSKAEDITNANMLSSIAYQKSYNSAQVGDNVYEAEAKIFEKVEDFYFDGANQSYTNATNNWRVTKVYSWNGPLNEDGTYKDFNNTGNDKNYDFTQSESYNVNTNQWLLSRHNLEYSKYMNPRSYTFTNGILNTNIYNIYHDKTIAKVFGCSRNSATFSSFEEHESSRVNGGLTTTGSVSFKTTEGSLEAHSGSQMLELSSGAKASVTFDNSNANIPIKLGWYRFDVWVNKLTSSPVKLAIKSGTTAIISPVDYTEDKVVGDWVLLSVEVEITSTHTSNPITFEVYNSGATAVYVDDFRVRPVDASMETYVFDATTGRLMSTLNPNHFATHYKYDLNGQVKEVWQESLKYGLQKMSESTYGYYRNVQQ